jgi:hypothetical protein
MQLAELITDRKVGFSFTHGAKRDRSLQDRWQLDARDFSCRLTYQGRSMTIDYWMGRGITRDPDATGVLDNLLSDASGFDSARDFNDWASDLGFETEDRESMKKAKKTYSAVQKQTERLKTLLGDDYEEFLIADR